MEVVFQVEDTVDRLKGKSYIGLSDCATQAFFLDMKLFFADIQLTPGKF